jgi:hypothetical protein
LPKQRGPPQIESEYKDEPWYRQFKTADKKVRALLKKEGRTMKGVLSGEEKMNAEDTAVVVAFEQTRAAWWLRKAELKNKQAETASKTQTPSSQTSTSNSSGTE